MKFDISVSKTTPKPQQIKYTYYHGHWRYKIVHVIFSKLIKLIGYELKYGQRTIMSSTGKFPVFRTGTISTLSTSGTICNKLAEPKCIQGLYFKMIHDRHDPSWMSTVWLAPTKGSNRSNWSNYLLLPSVFPVWDKRIIYWCFSVNSTH